MSNARYELPNLLRAHYEARADGGSATLAVAGMVSVYDRTTL